MRHNETVSVYFNFIVLLFYYFIGDGRKYGCNVHVHGIMRRAVFNKIVKASAASGNKIVKENTCSI